MFGSTLLLLDKVEFSSDILASFKLDILFVVFASSKEPSLLIFIWNNYIHPILCIGSFVSILEIIVFRWAEMGIGKANVCVFKTSIKFAIEFD